MTEEQLTLEEQEAMKVVAELLAFQTLGETRNGTFSTEAKTWKWVVDNDFVEEYFNKAKELLNLRGKCKACNGTGRKYTDNPRNTGDIPCPVCHGTGQGEKLLFTISEVKAIIKAHDRSLPRTLDELCGVDRSKDLFPHEFEG